jgi:hypothetical protein
MVGFYKNLIQVSAAALALALVSEPATSQDTADQSGLTDAELKALDPATRVEKITEKLGPTFSEGVKLLEEDGDPSATSASGSVWDSAGDFEDPSIAGVDVSTWFELENVSDPVGIYRYSSFGKADPFVAPIEQSIPESQTSLEIPIVSPLQVGIGTLKVVGLWSLEDGTRRALVLTQAGQGIIAKVGDPIGLSGKILDITPSGIISRQYRLRSDGAREFSDTSIPFITSGESSEVEKKVVLNPGKEPVVTSTTSAGQTTKPPGEINQVDSEIQSAKPDANDTPVKAQGGRG